MDTLYHCFLVFRQTGNSVEIRDKHKFLNLLCYICDCFFDEPRRDVEIKSSVPAIQNIVVRHGEHITFDDMDIVSVGMEQSTDVKSQEKDGIDLNSIELGSQLF